MWSEYRASYAPRYQSALCVLAGSWRTPLTPTVAPLKTCRNAALSGGAHDARGLPFLRLLRVLLWRGGRAGPEPKPSRVRRPLLAHGPRRTRTDGDPPRLRARAPPRGTRGSP